MKLRIFTEPQQGADYYTLRAVALAAQTVCWCSRAAKPRCGTVRTTARSG